MGHSEPVDGALEEDPAEHPQRGRADDTLRMGEARFRSFFELSRAGCAITSPTAGWVEVNDRLCEMLGYSREEIRRTTWAALTHPDDLPADRELFERVLSGELDGYSMDKRFVRGDGQIVWTSLSVRCVRAADGTVDCLVALLFDISERKRAEEAVKRQASFFQRMIDAMPYPVYYVDRRSRFLGCNRAFERFLGAAREQIAGRAACEIAPVPLAEECSRADDELLARPGTQTYDRAIQSADGSRHEVTFHKATFEGPDGEVEGMIGAIVDITDRKKAESAIEEQLDELRRWHRATLGRESRILELKREVNELLLEAGRSPRYPSALEEGRLPGE